MKIFFNKYQFKMIRAVKKTEGHLLSKRS